VSGSVQVDPSPGDSLHGDGSNRETNHATGSRSSVSSLTHETHSLNGMSSSTTHETPAESQRSVLGTSPTARSNNFLLSYQVHHRRRSADSAAFAASSGQSLGRSPTDRYQGSPSSQTNKSPHPGFLQSIQEVKHAIRFSRSSDASNLRFGLIQGLRHSDIPPVSNLAIQMEAYARGGAETSPAGEMHSSPSAPDHAQGKILPGEDTENVQPVATRARPCTSPSSNQSISSRDMEEIWRVCRELDCEQDSKSEQE
jgi:hypothetical protein